MRLRDVTAFLCIAVVFVPGHAFAQVAGTRWFDLRIAHGQK